MNIPVPPIIWPKEFQAMGPDGDPSIVLSADAQIGGVQFLLTGLRTHEGMRMPDYRADVPREAYEAKLHALLDAIETLSASIEPELLEISGATYLVWMVPRARQG
ncbi:MAG TPA: hypothetical protein VFI93_09540 [Rhizomicrobium sp.]|jgi:hypothetical protein|nr:hypothetical protein [Rhizomicrobium sp.]